MALVAIIVHKLIIAIHMAQLTLCGNMCTGQWKTCRAVAKCGSAPVGRGMALRTVMAVVAGTMVWVRCLLVLRLMALIAIVVHKLVVAVGVAQLALCRRVSTRQREVRGRVVKRSISPVRCRVALSTVMIEISRDMVGGSRGNERVLMTAEAFHGSTGEHVVAMAARALKWGMRSGERKSGQCRVVVSRAGPMSGRVTRLAL